MNSYRRRNEAWMIDMALGTSGTEAMWPGMVPAWLECGQRQIDLERTMSRVRSFKMITKEWERTARKLEAQALAAEQAGNTITASEFYHRAAICYGRSKWPIMDNSSVRKRELHDAEDRCFDKVIAYNDLYTLKRVEIPFDGSTIAGILHLPKDVKKPPCVIFVPGMDMTKEDFPNVQNNVFVRRGMACFSIDGPGQGASNLRGIQSRLGTYEKALTAVLDVLEKRDDIDSGNVSLLGLSLGGYYSVRGAAANPRFKAHVSMIGLYGHLDQFFMMAPPNFRHCFMYMAGIKTDAEMDAQVDDLSVPRTRAADQSADPDCDRRVRSAHPARGGRSVLRQHELSEGDLDRRRPISPGWRLAGQPVADDRRLDQACRKRWASGQSQRKNRHP